MVLSLMLESWLEQRSSMVRQGSIKEGKLADLVILSDNPMSIDPMQINKIKVLETIKKGKSVYTVK